MFTRITRIALLTMLVMLVIPLTPFEGGMLQAQITPFKNIVKINTTVGTATFTLVALKSGAKSFTVWNQGTGIVYVAFKNTKGTKDTVNVDSLGAGNKMYYDYQSNDTLWLKATVACNVKTTIYYGYGEAVREEYLNNGVPEVKINGDTVYVPRNNPTVTIDSLETGLDTTITITPNKNVKYVEIMVIDTGATTTDSVGIAFTLNGQTVLLGAIASADGTQSLTMANNNTGRLYLIYLPSSAGGTITLYLKNVIFTANKETKIVIIQQ